MKNPSFECAFTFSCVNKNAAFRLANWLSGRGLTPVRVNYVVAIDVDDVLIARDLIKNIQSTGYIDDEQFYEAN